MLKLGIDDAGRGPVIGAMVLAGVLIDSELEEELRGAGVKDSKSLQPEKREALAEVIKERSLSYKVMIITPKEIDGSINGGVNLNRIEAIKAGKIINKINDESLDKVEVVIDCPSRNLERWGKILRSYIKNQSNLDIKVEHEADKNYIAVGAASILAKSKREEEVEKIKKMIDEDIGSLPYDEEVLVETNDKIRIKKIGALCESCPKNTRVFSFNPKTLKISKHRVTKFIEHPKKRKIYDIYLEGGKKISLSLNHPVFILNKNLNIQTKKISDLEQGEFIGVAGNVNISSKLNFLNLLDYLPSFSNIKSPIYIGGKFIKGLFNKIPEKIHNISREQDYCRTSFYNWNRSEKKYLPLHILSKLTQQEKLKKPKQGWLKAREGTKLPLKLHLSKEFLWFLGIYIAEGYFTRDKIMICVTEEKIMKKLETFANKLNIPYYITKNKEEIGLNSVLLNKLIKSFNLGENAHEKRVPKFIFNLSSKKIKSFLKGIYDGDGYLSSGGSQEIETYSEELAKQIQWLELICGNFTSLRTRKNRDSFIIRILSESTNSLSPDNLPSVVGGYAKNLRVKNKLPRSSVAKKTGMYRRTINSIENRETKIISKKTLSKLNDLYKDKKLSTLLDSDIYWRRIKKIENTGKRRKVYDLEVKPQNKKIENFLGGKVGIILHNSGYPSDPITKKFLKKHVKKYKDEKIFRETWMTWQEAREKKEQKSLGDY